MNKHDVYMEKIFIELVELTAMPDVNISYDDQAKLVMTNLEKYIKDFPSKYSQSSPDKAGVSSRQTVGEKSQSGRDTFKYKEVDKCSIHGEYKPCRKCV